MAGESTGAYNYQTPITSELRIGLAMSGAIALVLYEAGVTHEVYRILRGWDAFSAADISPRDAVESSPEGYLSCFRHIPIRPVVDILTGASAGGVNSALLASCLVSGEDFAKYHDILLDELGLEALRYTPKDSPESLMDSRILLDVLKRELANNAAIAQRHANPPGLDLCVRLCRTHLAGHCETTRDAIGHEIDVETRSDVIEFATEDFVQPDRIDSVATATLATASFPGAFPPVQDDGIWYVDGGLWDNQPVDWAVQAVSDRPAFLRTDRCILFVEPNPAARPPAGACNDPEKKPSLADVLMAIPFMGIKGNIWPAIESILDYNRRGGVYADLVGNEQIQKTARLLGAQAVADADIQLSTASGLGAALDSGEWRNSAPEVPTLLNEVRLQSVLLDDDPALIQRWRAIVEAWNALQMRLPAAARALGFATAPNGESDRDPTPAHLAAIAALDAAGRYDLKRRAVRRRLEEINSEIRNSTPGGRLEAARTYAPLKARLYAQVEQLNRYLYTEIGANDDDCSAYHSRLVRYHSRFRAATTEMLRDLEYAFRYLFLVPGEAADDEDAAVRVDRLLGNEKTNPLRVLTRWIDAVRTEAERAAAETGVAGGLLEEDMGAESRWKSVRLYYQRRREERDGPEKEMLFPSLPGAPGADTPADTTVTDMDVARHILAAISDLDGKKPIDLVRVSPNDTNNLYLIPAVPDTGGTPATVKLAGEGIGHLQGFLQTRWRRNDYVWGRLDACEILLRTMRMYGERQGYPWSEPEYEQSLFEAQRAILCQEAALYDAWLTRHHKPAVAALANVDAISRADARAEYSGRPTLTPPPALSATRKANASIFGFGREALLDADEPAFTNNVNYLLQTTIRVLQGDAKEPPALLSRAARITRILSYGMRWVAAFAPPYREAPKASSVWKWSAFVLILIFIAGLAGWGMGAKHDLVNTAAAALYGVVAVLALISLGCVVGWRAGFATIVALVAGVCLGIGAIVWTHPGIFPPWHFVGSSHFPWVVAIPLSGMLAIAAFALLSHLMARIPKLK